MTLSITLIRHGRSEANHAEIWQGQGDSPLSDEGRRQAEALGDRLASRDLDLVVSSDLERARDTAFALGVPVEIDPAWREMDLGVWEGRSFSEVTATHPDLLQAIRRGDTVAFGETGETLAGFEARIWAALEALADRLGEGSVVVVTHGGVIDVIVGRILGRVDGRRTFPIVTNTSLTEIGTRRQWRTGNGLRLRSFNDATHLGIEVGALARLRQERVPVVGWVRHAVTRANKERRIQGWSCWGLDQEGHDQARRFAAWYGSVDRVVSSPTQRARETAEVVANGNLLEIDDDLQEMGFGEWEGVVFDDLRDNGDPLAERIWGGGEDLPRGHSGETFEALQARIDGFIERLTVDPAERTIVVSHGAAIKSVVAGIHRRGFDIMDSVSTPHNTAVSHVALTGEGPMLLDFSLAPHLEIS